MITSYEVGAVLRVVDEASPILQRIATAAREVEAAKASLARGEGIPHKEVLAEFGLTSEDFERLGRTPLKPSDPKQ